MYHRGIGVSSGHMKIAACESPFERFRRSVISALESHQRQFQGFRILEIHWCH